MIKNKVNYEIKNYLSLVKFSHTIFAMPFAVIGFALGIAELNIPFTFVPERYSPLLPSKFPLVDISLSTTAYIVRFICVILCMIFARSAAMAFNRWLDKTYDAKNPRTAIREIPAGIISG